MLFQPREKGQGLTEYALLLALVALIVVLILYVLGPAVGNLYTKINFHLPFVEAGRLRAPRSLGLSGGFWGVEASVRGLIAS